MARPKRTGLDEALDQFTDLDAEGRGAWLAAFTAADRALSRREGKMRGKTDNQPMLELGAAVAEAKTDDSIPF